MRKFPFLPKSSVLAVALHGVCQLLYLGWALTALALCGLVAVALL